MTFLINTFLGFLIAQVSDILMRNKRSDASPEKFSLKFFFQDTWLKITISLLLSISMSLLVWLNIEDFASIFGKEWTTVNNIVYAVIGFAPEKVLQWMKKKYGFLQPEKVGEHIRK